MSWEDILKRQTSLDEFEKPQISEDEMYRAIYKNWFYDDVDGYAEYTFEMYSDGSDAQFARTFYDIIDKMRKLDPVKDESKINQLLKKLEKHPMMPMESMDYPTLPSDGLTREELEELYEETQQGW